MLDRLLNFLTGAEVPSSEPRPDELELAVAALLVEAARMDDSFDAAERSTIERLLAARFDLTPEAVHTLVEAAEQRVRDSAQYFPFTHMTHAYMKFFTFHAVRWDDTPVVHDPATARAMPGNFARPISWSAAHIGGDGHHTWSSVLPPAPEVKR